MQKPMAWPRRRGGLRPPSGLAFLRRNDAAELAAEGKRAGAIDSEGTVVFDALHGEIAAVERYVNTFSVRVQRVGAFLNAVLLNRECAGVGRVERKQGIELVDQLCLFASVEGGWVSEGYGGSGAGSGFGFRGLGRKRMGTGGLGFR